jgi:hypothetical protein
MTQTLTWKEDWSQTQEAFIRWWKHQGMAIFLTAERAVPREPIPRPYEPPDIADQWLNPEYRCGMAEYEMARKDFLLEAFPYFDTQIGPGSLGIILGSKPLYVEGTVWYEAIIDDPEGYGPIRFNPENNTVWDQHVAMIDEGLRRANGRYLVGLPDLIENLDTLASLRGDNDLLFDMIERPEWVEEKLAEINQAYFTVFDLLFDKVKGPEGGNAFSAFTIWGPGRTAKLQCDISATLSPRMFKRFVVPYLKEQCEWLDYSLYHLDGTTCLQHLDYLLEIEALDAIEWTPQAGLAGGGTADWYNLYKRIKAGGKSVQAVGVEVDEVIPMLDAVGPEGVYIQMGRVVSQAEAETLLKALEPYR